MADLLEKRFNLKDLNNVTIKEQYQVKISNKFSALENLDDSVDILRETIGTSAKEMLGYCDLKQCKLRFDEVLKTIRLKEGGKIPMLEESKPNERR
jgi:hypothetical protein